jgi:THO complex subunit 2
MLETVMKWHAERESFKREYSEYLGFITKFRVTEKSSGNDTDTVDFENYRHVCRKWHFKIAKALVVCLESKDFVQIRNSLIVLTKIIQYFPAIQNLATVIEKSKFFSPFLIGR